MTNQAGWWGGRTSIEKAFLGVGGIVLVAAVLVGGGVLVVAVAEAIKRSALGGWS